MARPTTVPAELQSPSLVASRAYAAHDGQARIATAICFRRRECADVVATSRRIRQRDDPKAAGGLRARLPSKRGRLFAEYRLADRSRCRTVACTQGGPRVGPLWAGA